MRREDIQPCFRWMPRWALLVMMAVVGLPMHFCWHVWQGVREASESWWAEFKEITKEIE